MKIKIEGASDDLLYVEGGITEEFYPNTQEGSNGSLLAVSDGTLLRVVYDNDGIWRITRLVAGSATFEKTEGDVEKDTNDVVTLDGDIRWVVMGEQMAKA